MAKHIISDCGIFYAGYDFTGTMNQTEVTLSRDELEQTTFGDATRNFLPGLLTATATASGFFDATLSGVANANMPSSSEDALIIAPNSTEDGPAIVMASQLNSFTWGGEVGELATADLAWGTRSYAAKGNLAFDRTITSNVNSSVINLGALSASQTILLAVTTTGSTTGTSPTLDIELFSDSTSGFSSPTSRLSTSQLGSVRTSEVVKLSGAITDSYWRVSATVGGTSPSYSVAVAIAIATKI